VFWLTFVTLAIILIALGNFKPNCSAGDNFKKIKFYGVVTDKKLDTDRHSVPLLVVKEFHNNAYLNVDFFLEKTNSYKVININDTLLKTSNNDSLFVLKNNIKTLLQKVEFECPN
jgi:hypothetical protein